MFVPHPGEPLRPGFSLAPENRSVKLLLQMLNIKNEGVLKYTKGAAHNREPPSEERSNERDYTTKAEGKL
jgi:hypothetical protein